MLLNPHTTPEETLFVFSHDMKPRMATLAVWFTRSLKTLIGDSIRGGWRYIADDLLKLRKLQLLLQSATEFDSTDEETLIQWWSRI
ncbi:hypothetical protein Bca52824_023397 [Brassica carinata]|uniref:Uncharacterized protein n=1 Tax=Brassica carinata TaxID=52824 RepID=A0A8X7VI65_BRACI|nr:hypothetical protein Bca52824_023397 [Brassica carinata]